MDEDVALADRRENMSCSSASAASSARRRDRRPRRVAQLGVARAARRSARGRPGRAGPAIVVDLALLDPQRLDELLAQSRRSMPSCDLEPHDLAEAAAAQLVLDRLSRSSASSEIVEVGVAGDAEERVVDDLHAREERVEVVGDQVLERDEGLLALADRRRSAAAAPSAPSRGRRPSGRSAGRARSTARLSERFEMYGNGRPSPTASGVSTGKTWRLKRSSQRRRAGRRAPRRAR